MEGNVCVCAAVVARRYIYNQARCGRCGGGIRTWDMAARTCYACPTCQPLPPAAVLAAARAKALAAASPTKVLDCRECSFCFQIKPRPWLLRPDQGALCVVLLKFKNVYE